MFKIEKSAKPAVFASNWLFWWKNTILNVSEELEGYFQHFKKSTKKINQKNGHAGKVRIQRFGSKLKSPQNLLFLLQTDCFDERTQFWMFQKNCKGIFNISKNQPKKSTKKINQKNGQAGKVRIQRFCSKLKSPQNLLFLFQTDCFDERTEFWMFHKNWKGIFNISKNQPKKSTKKINQKNGHAGKVRIQRFGSKLKSPQNMLFLLQTDCFDERTQFWMFQKNYKGIFNISKNQPKKWPRR